MRTLFITEWFSPDVGGSITIYKNIYSRYPKEDIYILSKKTKGYKEYDKHSPFFIRRVPYRRYPFLKPESLIIYLAYLWKAFWIIKRYKIKLIHCDKVLPAGLVAFYLCKFMGTPYIVYAHGEEVSLYLQHSYAKKKMRQVFNGANKIIVNSNFTKRMLIKMGVKEEKPVIIHPGVDTSVFNPKVDSESVRLKFNLENKLVLLTVGRLQKRKGQDMVIQAMPELCKLFPNLVYLIVGDGKDKTFLQNLTRNLNMEERVIFAGEVVESELPFYYAACDVFIMANRQMQGGDVEGFGLVFLEASACGKPVIGGNSGGVPDTIINGETGFLIDGTKKEEIVNAVNELFRNREKANEMGKNGREWVVDQNFNWDSIYDRIKSLETLL